MADNPFKRPDESGFLDNDPFAELMRMADAPRASKSEPDLAANENFDIDLEREMLGDLDEADAVVPVQSSVADHWTQEPQYAAPEPAAHDEPFDDDAFGDLDLSLDLELEDNGHDLPLSATNEPQDDLVAPAIDFEGQGDDLSDDLDLAFDLELDDDGPHLPLSPADSSQNDLVAPPIAFEAEVDDVPDDFDVRSHALFAAVPEIDEGVSVAEPAVDDFDLAFEDFDDGDHTQPLAADEDSAFAQPVEPVAAFEFDRPEETVFADSSYPNDQTSDIERFEFDLQTGEHDQPEVFAAEVPAEAVAAEDFDLDFAFADDLNETGAPESAVPLDTFAHDDVLQAGPADDRLDDFVASDRNAAIGGAWSAADLQVEGPVESVAPPREDVAAWREPELRRDVSDDDDILGDIENWLNADPAPVYPAAAPETFASVETIRHEEVFAAPAVEQKPAPQPLSLEDELGALLGDDDSFSAASFEAPLEPVASQPIDEPVADDLDFDLDLDDVAFDSAEEYLPESNDRETVKAESNSWNDFDTQSPDALHGDRVEEPVAPKKTGPLAMLAALAPAAMARFGGGERGSAARTAEPVQPATPLFGMARTDRPVAPEIETVEVDEQPTAIVDDLDIPELAQPEEVAPLFSPDDLEAELDVAFGSLAPEEESANTVSASAPAASSADTIPLQGSYTDGDYGYVHEPQSAQADNDFGDVDFDYDPDTEPLDAPTPKDGMRRKYFILGGVGAVALLGGLGYFMAGSPTSDGLPVIVRADSDPVRVRPENRGGAVVPNQDSRAYQRATGATGTPGAGQEELMTSAEEPLDVRSAVAPPVGNDFPMVGMEEIPMLDDAGADAMLASVKNDERLGGAAETLEDEGISIAPRRVRTMVVRPDGTLVAREDVPAAPTLEQLEANAALSAQSQTPGLPRVEDAQPVGSIAPLQGEILPDDPVMPDTVGVVPSRPQARPEASGAAQAPVQLASAQPATTAPVAQSEAAATNTGEWSMQIASQPSAEGAQTAYQDLARRYASVLEGRGVNIVRAEIDGMGTFYRVRIQANTRDEAVQLCTQYKAAGGSCFVSR
ncbi:hypothetical protein GTW25_06720 [Aliihoeflea aestuarii]|uniref:SPOR domain-containing protein n=1 Tax=Aliihoeflea aestuarii TaxID=453840 RepID=UPI002093045A|nr:SPOR domain-containing protein [Aliihoeflea aestuarii]MCO6390720.1 hypothetical protein [Aliihoeflea aestuarii]